MEMNHPNYTPDEVQKPKDGGIDPHKEGCTSVKGTFGFTETSVARHHDADRRTQRHVDIWTLYLIFLIKHPSFALSK